MNDLSLLKQQCIGLLQKYSDCGKESNTGWTSLSSLNRKPGEKVKAFNDQVNQTRLLIHTNQIASPICLDPDIELPVVELFINNYNFVVYTTQGI